MIWDMQTINGTRYVIERSWVRAPLGVCYFPRHKIVIVSRTFVSQPLQAYIYDIYIIYIYAALLWQFDTWSPSIESKMGKKLKSSVKLKSVINPNQLWWSHHIRFPWKIFGMELSHWHMNKKQKALDPPNDEKRVINPHPSWWSHHIRFPRKIFGMELSHWHMNKKQKALAPPNDLASIAWTKLHFSV